MIWFECKKKKWFNEIVDGIRDDDDDLMSWLVRGGDSDGKGFGNGTVKDGTCTSIFLNCWFRSSVIFMRFSISNVMESLSEKILSLSFKKVVVLLLLLSFCKKDSILHKKESCSSNS